MMMLKGHLVVMVLPVVQLLIVMVHAVVDGFVNIVGDKLLIWLNLGKI
jgi:hypothetical protein